ncbi:MAG: hypothetical protein AB8G14_08225 [Ilumatobacter sp.]
MTVIDATRPATSTATGVVARRCAAVGLAIALVSLGMVLATHPIGKLVAIVALISATIVVSVERMIIVLLVIYLAVEDYAAGPFNGLWTSPVDEVGDFFFATISTSVDFVPIPMAPMMICPLILVTRSVLNRTGDGLQHRTDLLATPRVFSTALLLAGTSIGLAVLYGAGTGGDPQQVYYQIFGLVIALSFAATVARVGTPKLAASVWRVVLIIGIYRAALALFVYFAHARDLDETPLYLTTHADSIIWTLGIVYLASNLLERADRVSKVMAIVLGPLLCFAVVVNNRRLAWVMVAAAVAYVVWTLIGVGRRRVSDIAVYVAPLFGTYLAAGWVSPPSKYFAPVQALKSVVSGDDRSSQTRNIEDFNLLFTARTTFPLPSGFGKPYVELVVADDISAFFEQYQYLPHNTILGLMFMLGPVGLALVIVPLALGVHAAHRVRCVARESHIRTQTAMVLTTWVSFLAFAWGDLGFFTPQPTALVGVAAGLGVGLNNWYRQHGERAANLERYA